MRFTASGTALKSFIRIGDVIIDPMEVSAVTPYASDLLSHPRLTVMLRGTENFVYVDISADEFWEKITEWAASKP